MSISAYGVQGTLDDSHWAMMLKQLGDARAGMSVKSGLVVSAATGTRLLNVSPGHSLQAGVYVIAASGSTYTVTVAANTATNSRYDLICMQVDWLAAEAAYTAAGGDANAVAAGAASKAAGASLVAVQGVAAASPSLPSLTQTEGTLWQTPLGRVLVRPGVTQIASADVTFWQPLDFEGCISGKVTITPSAADTAKSQTVTFPGAGFASVPDITLSLSSPVTGYNVVFWDSNVTQTGFTANLLRGSSTATTLTWKASATS